MLHVRAFTVICGTRVTSSRSRILVKTKPEARMLNGWMSSEKKASFLCQRLLSVPKTTGQVVRRALF